MRILVVDDEKDNRCLLYYMLSEFGECEQAVDGEQAFNMYKQSIQKNQPYNLITLDMLMPKLDGIEVMKKIREFEANNDVDLDNQQKIIVITGCDNDMYITESFNHNCSGFIEKPVSKENLVTVMRYLNLLD